MKALQYQVVSTYPNGNIGGNTFRSLTESMAYIKYCIKDGAISCALNKL